MGSLYDQLDLLARAAGCVLAAVPSTSLPPLPLTMALTQRFRREERLRRLHRMVGWASFCRRHLLGIELEVHGREHLPGRSSRGHMFVSNHQSWADILVLMEALHTVAFLSKRIIKRIPLIGACAYAGGTIFVARSSAESRGRALLETLRMCEESTAVVIFPEGTRSPDGEIAKRIHPASLRAAYQRGLTVIPVGVDGTYRVLPKSMDRVRPGEVVVSIGAPIRPHQVSSGAAWVELVWANVKELHRSSRARLGGKEPAPAPAPGESPTAAAGCSPGRSERLAGVP